MVMFAPCLTMNSFVSVGTGKFQKITEKFLVRLVAKELHHSVQIIAGEAGLCKFVQTESPLHQVEGPFDIVCDRGQQSILFVHATDAAGNSRQPKPVGHIQPFEPGHNSVRGRVE